MVKSLNSSLFTKLVEVSVIHVVRCCIYGFQADVRADYLDVNMLLNFLEIVQFRSKPFVLIRTVDGPLLEWKFHSVHFPHRLV